MECKDHKPKAVPLGNGIFRDECEVCDSILVPDFENHVKGSSIPFKALKKGVVINLADYRRSRYMMKEFEIPSEEEGDSNG